MKKMNLLLTAACAALCFAACGSAKTETKAPEAAQAAAEETKAEAADKEEASQAEAGEDDGLKKVDVVLDWFPNAVHTFLYEADRKGYFAEEGLKVNLISPADSIDAITFVSAGRAEIGLSYPIDIITAYANENMPVTAIGAISQRTQGCMSSLPESGIKELSDLKGKKIGYSGTIAGKALLETVCGNAGLTPDDYELINVGFDLVSSLTTGSVDFSEGMFINDEIPTMRLAGYDVDVWNYSDYGVPVMYGLVLAANKEAVEADPEMYAGFLRACRKGFEDMAASEEDAMEVIMQSMNSDDNPLDEEQQRQSYEILMPIMDDGEHPFLSMDPETWQKDIDWMAESGIIETSIDASEIYTVFGE